MDTTVNLIIRSKPTAASTTRTTTTITNVNPGANSSELYALGIKFHSLMTTIEPIITKETTDVLTAES